MNRLALVPALLLALSVLMLAQPAQASATDTHYFLEECPSGEWTDDACWAHESQGTSGQGAPTANNPAILDGGIDNSGFLAMTITGDAFAKSVNFGEEDQMDFLVEFNAGLLAVSDEITVESLGGIQFTFGGGGLGLTWGRNPFAVNSPPGNPLDMQGAGDAAIEYTGTAEAGCITGPGTITDMEALGKTVYAPDMTDGGSNVNILFEEAPEGACVEPVVADEPPVACGLADALPNANLPAILLIVLGAGVLVLVLNFWLGMRGDGMSRERMLTLVGGAVATVVVVIVAAVVASNLSCG